MQGLKVSCDEGWDGASHARNRTWRVACWEVCPQGVRRGWGEWIQGQQSAPMGAGKVFKLGRDQVWFKLVKKGLIVSWEGWGERGWSRLSRVELEFSILMKTEQAVFLTIRAAELKPPLSMEHVPGPCPLSIPCTLRERSPTIIIPSSSQEDVAEGGSDFHPGSHC